MTSRYECKVEGFEKNWVEVADKWTMKEVRQLVDSDDVGYFDIFGKKVLDMYIEAEDGTVYRDPKELTEEVLENLDITLVGFLGGVMSMHIERRRQLGKWGASLSKDGSEENSSKKKK